MRVLFLGDIVGEVGRKVVKRHLPKLRQHLGLDLVVANAENASGGSGFDKTAYKQLVAAGIDAFTLGDHAYRKREVYELFASGAAVCRPANFPVGSPGNGSVVVATAAGIQVAIVNVMGRTFMRPCDCPFAAIDRVLSGLDPDIRIILVDIHAEATSDKQLMLRHCLGRVSAVIGTHTHVPTADARVYPAGTAYITDVGMTGPYESIIGRDTDAVLHHAVTFEPIHFDVAKKDLRWGGAILDIDETTGKARSIALAHWDEPTILSMLPAESECVEARAGDIASVGATVSVA